MIRSASKAGKILFIWNRAFASQYCLCHVFLLKCLAERQIVIASCFWLLFLFLQQTSEFNVLLPFCGKICLFPSKGKWARVEVRSIQNAATVCPHRNVSSFCSTQSECLSSMKYFMCVTIGFLTSKLCSCFLLSDKNYSH